MPSRKWNHPQYYSLNQINSSKSIRFHFQFHVFLQALNATKFKIHYFLSYAQFKALYSFQKREYPLCPFTAVVHNWESSFPTSINLSIEITNHTTCHKKTWQSAFLFTVATQVYYQTKYKLTVRFLVACTSTWSTKFLGLAASGVCHKKGTVVLYQNVLDFLFWGLVHIYTNIENEDCYSRYPKLY